MKKPVIIFLVSFTIIALVLFLLPINLFPGEIVLADNLVEVKEQTNLSLSYFIGMGYDEKDMDIVKDFYLLPQGYALAFILLIGLPLVFAIRSRYTKK